MEDMDYFGMNPYYLAYANSSKSISSVTHSSLSSPDLNHFISSILWSSNPYRPYDSSVDFPEIIDLSGDVDSDDDFA